MDELIKGLGPWPTAQGIAIGFMIAGVAAWAMRRGLQGSRDIPIEDVKAKWGLYEQVRHIHENSFAIVRHLEKSNEIAGQILTALNRFNDSRWNKQQ